MLKKNLAHICTKNINRFSPRGATVWLAWRDGLNGGTWVHATPLASAFIGGFFAVSGLVLDLTDKLPKLPVPIGLIVIGGAGVGAAGAFLNNRVQDQAKKHDGHLDKDFDLYTDSLIEGGRIDKPSQAYLLGRAIHQLGYGLMSDIGRERHQRSVARAQKKPLVTITDADFDGIIDRYYKFNTLLVLAERAGLMPRGSESEKIIGREWVKSINAGLEYLAEKKERPEAYKAVIEEVQKHREKQAKLPGTGLCRPLRELPPAALPETTPLVLP